MTGTTGALMTLTEINPAEQDRKEKNQTEQIENSTRPTMINGSETKAETISGSNPSLRLSLYL